MKKYTHLTSEQRYQIRGLLNAKYTQAAIARELNVSPSTVGREVKRNLGQGHYVPLQASRISSQRRSQCQNAKKFTADDWSLVDACLHERFSPEQIANRLALTKQRRISHQAIYTHVADDKVSGGILHTLLRTKKPYSRRCKGGAKKREIIKNRVSIELRPAIVEEKSRIGDFEGDTVMGKNHQGAIVTVVDRHSRFTFACALPTKQAKGVTAAIKAMLKPHMDRCHTITFDNGTEFAGHGKIAKALDIQTFFAHPYSSWERGANENTNGLLRQYYPKGINLRGLSNAELQKAIHQMNHRPRKCLGYRTPYEVFFNLPSSWNNPLLNVALRT